MGDLPVIGSYLDGATLTTGYERDEVSRVPGTTDLYDLTAAINYNIGNFKLGYQKKYHNEGQTAATTDAVWYKDEVIGIAYAVNDNLSLSYNTYDSYIHTSNGGTGQPNQETTAINIGYTMGGMTIGFQDAQTDNDNWTADSTDDTRTLGISVAF